MHWLPHESLHGHPHTFFKAQSQTPWHVFPAQHSPPPHPPQSIVPPHPVGIVPQSPAVHVLGMQTHWPAWQTSGAGQVPHVGVLPHPSSHVPQAFPEQHPFGVQPHTPGVPPPPHVSFPAQTLPVSQHGSPVAPHGTHTPFWGTLPAEQVTQTPASSTMSVPHSGRSAPPSAGLVAS